MPDDKGKPDLAPSEPVVDLDAPISNDPPPEIGTSDKFPLPPPETLEDE